MKNSVILNNVGSCCDRYLSSGYGDSFSTEELLNRVASIGVKYVELIGNSNITLENAGEVKKLLDKYGMQAISIIPDHFGKQVWGRGAFTSPDAQTRKLAIQYTKDTIEAAKIIKCPLVSIWNGQDGYDYPMQVDYEEEHNHLIEGLRECAQYAPDMKIALEYKAKEPRNHSYISNISSTLLLIQDINCENVGVTIDTGHSLLGYENMAEAVSYAASRKKLFHMHFNDNYRYWDDDMICGSIHSIEYIELFYYLKKYNYDGFLSTDQYPYREDSLKAVSESLKWMNVFNHLADKINPAEMRTIFAEQDAVGSTAYLRKLMFGEIE